MVKRIAIGIRNLCALNQVEAGKCLPYFMNEMPIGDKQAQAKIIRPPCARFPTVALLTRTSELAVTVGAGTSMHEVHSSADGLHM